MFWHTEEKQANQSANTQTREVRQIPVTVDKSHLVTIGEKLYTQKTDLIRELVNNAYDADATEVHITLQPHQLVVHDNGSGMNEDGLHTYFTIGSTNKKTTTLSPIFQRRRIGEFGIGKFAALSACRIFTVETQRDTFRAKLLFDKDAWQRHEEWHIDIEILSPDASFGTGTKVTLVDLEHEFFVPNVRRYLRERVPLQVSNFAVFVNGERLEEEVLSGRVRRVKASTLFGQVSGALALTSQPWAPDDKGIGLYVRGVLVTKESFGLETSKKLGATRIRGKLYADFLPVPRRLDAVSRDSAEFQAVRLVVEKELKQLLKEAKNLADRRADLRSSEALKDVLFKLGRALKKIEGPRHRTVVPVAEEGEAPFSAQGQEVSVSRAQFIPSQADLPKEIQDRLSSSKKTVQRRGRVSAILGSHSIVRRLRFAEVEFAVRMEHLSEQEPESLLSGGVIYINLDHPLYCLAHQDEKLLPMHVARLLAKEFALEQAPLSASLAFQKQTELLTEAFRFTKKF
jgi:hypothetical protein